MHLSSVRLWKPGVAAQLQQPQAARAFPLGKDSSTFDVYTGGAKIG